MSSRLTVNEYRLWVVFHQTYDLINRCKEILFSDINTTDQQYQVLWLMEYFYSTSDKPLTISILSDLLFRSMNSASSIVNRMKKNGLVEKKRDLPDERAIRLVMTPKGKEMLKNVSMPSDSMIKKLFSALSDEEMNTLVFLLDKMKTTASQELKIEKNDTDPELSDPIKIIEFLSKLHP